MANPISRISSSLPQVLTVEEAARVLRISRTTAYAMALEWRVTGGKSGLKVIEIGGQLRVPRAWLEELLGAPIEHIPDPPPAPKTEEPSAPESDSTEEPSAEPSASESDKKSPSSQDPKPQHGANKKKKGRAA